MAKCHHEPLMLFFFSSRRRHTRCLSDWSSDVCSSDLGRPRALRGGRTADRRRLPTRALAGASDEIGRASCRERVLFLGVPDSLAKKSTCPKLLFAPYFMRKQTPSISAAITPSRRYAAH